MRVRLDRLFGRRRGILLLAAGFIIAWAGCVSLQPSVPMAGPVARVAVANLTDYTWEIAVRSSAPGEARAERLRPRAIAQWNLAEGDYVIEQKLVEGTSMAEPSRRFSARLLAGVDYKWSLATAQSTAGPETSPH